MLFNLSAPCADCPFRRDCSPGWLGRGRAEQIAGYLEKDDKTFACHKTTHRRKINRSHCAGALHLLSKTDTPHRMVVIARILGIYAGHHILKNLAATFDTFREFEAHHGHESNRPA